jgi:16S rRNA G966 N2-methylase RsmD
METRLRLPAKALDRSHDDTKRVHVREFEGNLSICTSADLMCEATGGDVWLGGFALAKFLADKPELIAGKAVLELGAGTGFLGICAATLGAARVAVTDLDIMEGLMRENVMRNSAQLKCEVAVQSLDWCDGLFPIARHMPVDVVLATDLLYQASNIDPLVALLVAMSVQSHRDGFDLYLAQSHRDETIEHAFFTQLSAVGFDWSDVTADSASFAQLKRSGVSLFKATTPGSAQLAPAATAAAGTEQLVPPTIFGSLAAVNIEPEPAARSE